MNKNNYDDNPDENINLERYRFPEVVSYYAKLDKLQPVESALFEKYITPGLDVLDIGVGGGRTTSRVAAKAHTYLGIDYSVAMVEVCRKRFPELTFKVMDATDLHALSTNSFDVIVFSFNGIDYIYPESKRAQCFKEVERILRPGGKFIFSEHNARYLYYKPDFQNAGVPRSVWRMLRSMTLSAKALFLRLPSRIFWNGSGYFIDPVHGGLWTYSTIPDKLREELSKTNLFFEYFATASWPNRVGTLSSPWIYYVTSKRK